MFEIGLDLSSYKISASEILKKKNDLVLNNIGFIDLEPHCIVAGEVIDSIVLINGLKELWKIFKFKNKSVNIGLSGIKNIIKEIELPVVEEKEIENALKYQISDFIPIAKENLIYDYYVFEKKENSVKIMLIGVLKSMINNIVDTVRSAGLNINSIDLNCFSLYRTINQIYRLKQEAAENDNNSICIAYLGQEVSIVEFSCANELRYPRFINSSVDTFIDNLKKKMKTENLNAIDIINSFDFDILLSKEFKKPIKAEGEADKNINESNSAEDDETTANPEKNIIENEKLLSRESMKLSANQFINEISRSIEHFLQENRENKIEKIFVTGENFKNLDKYIEKNIKYPIERVDISSKLSSDLYKKSKILNEINISDLSSRILLSYGLALRGLK